MVILCDYSYIDVIIVGIFLYKCVHSTHYTTSCFTSHIFSLAFFLSIGLQEIRHMGNEEGLLEKVASILLRPDDTTFKVSYKRVEGQLLGGSQDSKNTTSVNMLVRKTHLNNLVRPIWDDHLNDICHAFHDDLPLFARNALVMHEGKRHSKSEPPSSTSGLAFSVMMGDTINKLHKEIETLRTQNKQLETNTLRWKSTSEKLSNQWESEKSELTDRFLTLFNVHKARHIETQKELDQLKGKTQQRTTERGTRGAGTLSNRSNIRKSFEPLPDHEDEHDYAKYSSSFVDRLAAGPSTMKRRANDRDPMGGVSQKQKRQDSQSQESGFVNPHTGAMEFGNAKDMFSSSDEEEGGGMKG